MWDIQFFAIFMAKFETFQCRKGAVSCLEKFLQVRWVSCKGNPTDAITTFECGKHSNNIPSLCGSGKGVVVDLNWQGREVTRHDGPHVACYFGSQDKA